MKTLNRYWVLVGLIFLGALFFRLAGLTSLPPGIYPDEAMNTTDGLTTAEQGGWEWFYRNNQGREGLYINILGYLLHWFGPSIFVVRLFPALIGFFTLPAVFWLAWRLKGPTASIYALALMSFSYWHLNFSRIGFRALLMVFLVTWTFAFLIEAFYRLRNFKKESLSGLTGFFFVLSGLFLGLSFHTYIAVRIVPLIVFLVWFFAFLFLGRDGRKKVFWAGVIFALGAFLTALPLALYFVNYPEDFSGRTNNVSVFKSDNVILSLAKTTELTLASFVFYGDQNWRHNYPYLPLTLPFWGILLLAGIAYGKWTVLKQSIAFFLKKKVDPRTIWESFVWFFLISWWVLLLLPSILTTEGIPHALRSIGSLPPTFIIIGIIISSICQRPKFKNLFFGLTVITVVINMGAYFFLWGRSQETYGAFDYQFSAMGTFLREEALKNPQANFYVVANNDSLKTSVGLPVAAEPIRFFTWEVKKQINFVLPEELDSLVLEKPAFLVMMKDDVQIANSLKNKNPEIEIQKVRAGRGPITDKEVVAFNPENKEGFLDPAVDFYVDFNLFKFE